LQGGYSQKVKQSKYFVRYGLFSLIPVVVISVAAALPTLASLLIWVGFFAMAQSVSSKIQSDP